MAFSVNEFRSSFSNSGEPASAANFEVRILKAPPVISKSVSKDLVYRAQTASIPGKTLATIERKTYGPLRKIVYGAIYDDITITFIVSNNLQERNYFSVWQTLISDPTVNGDVTYYDDYVGTVQIVAYDDEGHETAIIQLNEAYPVRVAPIQISWDSKEYIKLEVDFAYHHWHDIISDRKTSFNDIINTVSSGVALASSVKSLASLGKTASSGNLGGLVGAGAAALPVVSGVANAISGVKKLLGGDVKGSTGGPIPDRGNLKSGLAPFVKSAGTGGGIAGSNSSDKADSDSSLAGKFKSNASNLANQAITKLKSFF